MRCGGVSLLDQLDGIWGGIEVIVVETHGLEDIRLLKEGEPEVIVSQKSWWNVLLVVAVEKSEIECEKVPDQMEQYRSLGLNERKTQS